MLRYIPENQNISSRIWSGYYLISVIRNWKRRYGNYEMSCNGSTNMSKNDDYYLMTQACWWQRQALFVALFICVVALISGPRKFIIADREKLEETDEYTRAEEEEWESSRQRELKIQVLLRQLNYSLRQFWSETVSNDSKMKNLW